VLIETNGSLDIAAIPLRSRLSWDINVPGSGSTSLYPDNIETHQETGSPAAGSTEIKFVLSNLEDYIWAKEMVLHNALHTFAPVLFSPVRNLLPAKDLADAILRDRLPVRLQLQLHTIIWPEKSRGV